MVSKLEVAAKLLIDRLESKEENLPYETVVIKTKLKERSPQEKGNHYRSRC
jgi:LacI family transcriptional regulator